jgi:hypothetical protein
MPIDLVDLLTCELYGPFNSPAEARASATKSKLRAYAIWEDGKRIDIVGQELLQEQMKSTISE